MARIPAACGGSRRLIAPSLTVAFIAESAIRAVFFPTRRAPDGWRRSPLTMAPVEPGLWEPVWASTETAVLEARASEWRALALGASGAGGMVGGRRGGRGTPHCFFLRFVHIRHGNKICFPRKPATCLSGKTGSVNPRLVRRADRSRGSLDLAPNEFPYRSGARLRMTRESTSAASASVRAMQWLIDQQLHFAARLSPPQFRARSFVAA